MLTKKEIKNLANSIFAGELYQIDWSQWESDGSGSVFLSSKTFKTHGYDVILEIQVYEKMRVFATLGRNHRGDFQVFKDLGEVATLDWDMIEAWFADPDEAGEDPGMTIRSLLCGALQAEMDKIRSLVDFFF